MTGHESVEFKPSAIQGTGCFALKPISRGTRLIEYVGEKIGKEESSRRCEAGNHFIFELDDETDVDGNVEWNPARFINHSCDPNCEAEVEDGHIWISSLRDISPGEELTFNYGYDLADYRDHPCRCGAEQCVGFMVAEEFFGHVRTQNALKSEVVAGAVPAEH